MLTSYKLKDPGNTIIATARNTTGSKGLQALVMKYSKERLILVDLDVTNAANIREVAKLLEILVPEGLDHFISNAGLSHQPIATFDEM